MIEYGSTDGTADMLMNLKSKNHINQWRTNQGKYMAVNAISKIAKVEILLLLTMKANWYQIL